MADIFLDIIADEISTYNTAHSLGYTIVKQNSPARKIYDNTPLLIICPDKNDEIKLIAFGSLGVVSGFDIYLVQQGNLNNTFTDFSDDLLTMLIQIFIPTPQSMLDANCYLTNVKHLYSYDRNSFPMGYLVSACKVECSFDKKDF